MSYLKIFKYAIPGPGRFSIKMPRGSKVLGIGMQHSGFFADPVMWAQFETENQDVLEERIFAVLPTGLEFDAAELSYIGTFQKESHNGVFVGHLYERKA